MKVKGISKIKGMKIPKISNKDMNTKIYNFYQEFNKQLPEIENKLKISKGKNKEVIKDFYLDIIKMKKFVDDLVEVREKKGIRGKIALTKFVTLTTRKALVHGMKIMRKWKKFDYHIDNFPI